LGLAFNQLVHTGVIDLVRLIELFSTNPAKIFRLHGRGSLKPGSEADITVLDPSLDWEYSNSDSRSKSRNSPFDATRFHGAAVATFVGGKLVYKR
jgi:dihydroorotase